MKGNPHLAVDTSSSSFNEVDMVSLTLFVRKEKACKTFLNGKENASISVFNKNMSCRATPI